MTVAALLTSQKAQYKTSAILKSTDQLNIVPLMPIEVEDQTETTLALKPGDDMSKGILTGALGSFGFLGGLYITYVSINAGDSAFALGSFIFSVAILIVPFLYEIFSSMPPPIIFNRRTREIYFQHDNQLYHTPWDGIGAVAYEYQMVHQNVGAMTNAPLEVLMQRFGKPDDRIFVALGLPMGKSLELQQQIWAYLQAYMDRGPWLDEAGNSSDSPEFVKQHLEINRSNHRDSLKSDWARWCETKEGLHFFFFLSSVFFYPMNALWDFTRDVSIKRRRHNWPTVVLERLKAEGPTTRLIDIEAEPNRAQPIK